MNKYVLILVVLVCVVSCKKKEDTSVSKPLKVEVATPIVEDVILSQTFPGYLKADKTVQLVARVDGFLQESYLKPGGKVNKGDLIFVINPDIYENDVKQSEASLMTSKAEYAYAKSNYERMKEASKTGAVSEIQVLEAESTMREQEASIKNAEAALDIAKINLGYCYVRAPFNGRVTVNVYDVGNYVSGSGTPVVLATLYKDDVIYAYFSLAEKEYVILKEQIFSGLPDSLKNVVTVRFQGDSVVSYSGIMDYRSPNVNISTGTIEFRAIMKNPTGFLKDGMIVSVDMPYAGINDAILVNDASIGTDQLGKYIYVVNDSNVVSKQHIKVGDIYNDTLRLVLQGLTGKERYVLTGLLKVREGMKIDPIK